jgi:hypothetical protein
MRSAWIVVLGCSSAPAKRVEPGPPATPDAAVPSAVDAAIAEVPIDAPIDAPPPVALALDGKPPPLPGKPTKLEEGKTTTVGGVTIKFAGASHKRPMQGGPSLGMWSFDLARGGKRESIELRDDASHFESEVDALGVALVFRHVDYTTFEITLAAARSPTALTDDACAELIEKAAVKRGLPDSLSGYTTDNGIVVARAPRWTGHCGTLTRRIWFTPATP